MPFFRPLFVFKKKQWVPQPQPHVCLGKAEPKSLRKIMNCYQNSLTMSKKETWSGKYIFSWHSIAVHGRLRALMPIHGNSWQFMKHHEIWWWFVTIHDDSWSFKYACVFLDNWTWQLIKKRQQDKFNVEKITQAKWQ